MKRTGKGTHTIEIRKKIRIKLGGEDDRKGWEKNEEEQQAQQEREVIEK